MHPTATVTFGTLLKQLRKRGGMTQRDLAAALGYSDSLISSLERGQRQPDIQTILRHFVPALGLQNDPATAKMRLRRGLAIDQRNAPSARQ